MIIEKEILGCFLKDNSLVEDTIISTNHFKEEPHKLLFQSMKQLSYENKAIDKVSLMSANYQYIQQMGGPSFITELETVGRLDNFETYERQFIDQYKKRESENIVKNWLSDDGDVNNLISDLQHLEEFGVIDDIDINELLESMYNLPYDDSAKELGVKIGLDSLDNLLGGFQNHASYILGARPSMGKSATMLKFALSASQSGAVPLIFSLEMSKESLIRRLISTIGTINMFIAKNPNELQESKKQAWQQSVRELQKLDFEIYDESLQTIQHMRSQIRKAKKKYNKQIIVFIDYLTLIHSDKTYQSDHSMVTDISKGLKRIARDYDCPVVTLAQLSRAVEQRQDKRPMLSDLRESGSIEQDADAVLFLYRDSYYNDTDNDNLEINVAKHRDGPTGSVEIYYNKATGKMGDLNDY